MMIRGFFAAFVLIASGLLAGCADDGQPSPFEGDWVSATAGRLSFDDQQWSDGDGDSGRFSLSGKYPTFNVIFVSDAGEVERVATFADSHTFELCEPGTVNCDEFVYDKPTIH